MNTDGVAWVFPGQGAGSAELLAQVELFRQLPQARQAYELLCSRLGAEPAEIAARGELNANRASSLVATFLAAVAMRHVRESDDLAAYAQPFAAAGYSVGQWSALSAAGVVGTEELFDTVSRRATAMDEALAGEVTGMLAVIGIDEPDVEDICAANREAGGSARISNYNSTTNCSVAGTVADLERVAEQLRARNPKLLEFLPVAGAWHSPFLEPAAGTFAEYLKSVELKPQAVDVIDNTTGGWLPSGGGERAHRLARHLCEPVRWYQGLGTMIASGATTIVELGAGNMLSTFGMFYDRSVRHVPLIQLSREIRAARRAGNSGPAQ